MDLSIGDYERVIHKNNRFEVRLINDGIDSAHVNVKNIYQWNYIVYYPEYGTIEGSYQQLIQAVSVSEQMNQMIKYRSFLIPDDPELDVIKTSPPSRPTTGISGNVLSFTKGSPDDKD